MAGNSLLFPASSICFHPRLQLLSRTKSHDTTGCYRNFFTRFRISARTLILVPKVKIPKAREFDLLALGQRQPYLLEEQVHQLLGFALVQAELVEEGFGHFRLGQCHHGYSLSCAPSDSWSRDATRCMTASTSWSTRVREESCKIKLKATLFRPESTAVPR